MTIILVEIDLLIIIWVKTELEGQQTSYLENYQGNRVLMQSDRVHQSDNIENDSVVMIKGYCNSSFSFGRNTPDSYKGK